MRELAENLNQIIDNFDKSYSVEMNWEFKPGPDKWSGKQILGHLIDSALNNIQRFIRGTYEEDFKIVYNQNEWVMHQHYDQADINDLIQLWKLLNKQIVRILANHPHERAEIKSDTGADLSEFNTMRQIAQGYIDHLSHHLMQINKVIAQ